MFAVSDVNQNFAKPSVHPMTAQERAKLDEEVGRLHRVSFPNVPTDRLALIYSRYGHVPIYEKEFEKLGCSIYWKTDRRWVNQGTCFYNHANNTYYMRSTRRGQHAEYDFEPRDVAWLEVWKSQMPHNYEHLTFYISPPADDRLQHKIVPCEHHKRDHQSSTFLGIDAVNLKTRPRIYTDQRHDFFQFDISGCSDQVLAFRVQFHCWTVCQRINFSNKKSNLVFHAVFSGPNLPPIKLSCNLNIQQNPGRGSSSGSTGKSGKTGSTIPNINSVWSKNSDNFLKRMRSEAGSGGVVSVQDDYQIINIRIEPPPNFQLILGQAQTAMVYEEIKRDVQYLVESRLNDAINRRPLSNPELLKRKEELEAENRKLRLMNQNLSDTARKACQMNDDILKLRSMGVFDPPVSTPVSANKAAAIITTPPSTNSNLLFNLAGTQQKSNSEIVVD